MPSKALVVDANILVRGVLGKRVREVIETYAAQVSFLVPDVAYLDAGEYLPALVARRGGDPEMALAVLGSLSRFVELVGSDVYAAFEDEARDRLAMQVLTTGPSSQPPWLSIVPSGRKTPISLDAA